MYVCYELCVLWTLIFSHDSTWKFSFIVHVEVEKICANFCHLLYYFHWQKFYHANFCPLLMIA